MGSTGRDYMVKSVLRVVKVLGCFTEDRPEWGLSELSAHLGMAKSTLHNLLSTLRSGKFIDYDDRSNTYRLGLKAFELGFVVRHSMRPIDMLIPYLEDLQEKTQEIVYLTTLCGNEVLYLEAIYPPRRLVRYSIAGRKGPLHCTAVGKATLAYLPEPAQETILRSLPLMRFTDNTITSLGGLRRELASIRERGYAIDNREHDGETRCVAAPIRSRRNGYAIGSVSVSGLALRFSEERIPYYASLVLETANNIARRVDSLPFGDQLDCSCQRTMDG